MTAWKEISKICVYCGSRTGKNPHHEQAAIKLGHWIGAQGKTLVYGAGSIGLMGITARSVMEKGGDVIGIIPEHLDKVEITQQGMQETIITDNMHERKNLMFEKSDAFVVLPGGLGSMDEFFEMLTWSQLQLHCKPIYLYNVDDYWTPLVAFIDHIIEEGFADEGNKNLFTVINSHDDLIAALMSGYDENFKSKNKFL